MSLTQTHRSNGNPISSRIVLAIILFLGINSHSQAIQLSDANNSGTNNLTNQYSIPCQASIIADARFKEIRSRIIEMVTREEIPSMAIAVAMDGKIIWEEAIGWADKKKKIGATPETIYPLASLSKSITATGLMTLVEKGLIDLDDPVDNYLPLGILRVYEGESSDLKVKHILSMTGGIPHGSVNYWEYGGPYSPIPVNEFVGRYIQSVFPPGEVYHYSNFSMGLPEPMIAHVTGKELAVFMSEEVFHPLGMHRTFVRYPAEMDNIAVKYGPQGNWLYHLYFGPLGGAGFYSCVHDLIRYGIFHLKNDLPGQKKILKDETIDAMHTVPDPNVPGAVMGLGWASNKLDDGFTHIFSNGEIYGASSNVTIVPSKVVAVACLTNINTQITDEIATEIVNVLMPGYAEKVEAAVERYKSQRATKPYQPEQRFIGRWKGEIKTDTKSIPVRAVFQEDGDIHIKLGEQGETLLNSATILKDELEGSFIGAIPNHEEFDHPHTIKIQVIQKQNRLIGFVTSEFYIWDKGVFALPYYISLVKATDDID